MLDMVAVTLPPPPPHPQLTLDTTATRTCSCLPTACPTARSHSHSLAPALCSLSSPTSTPHLPTCPLAHPGLETRISRLPLLPPCAVRAYLQPAISPKGPPTAIRCTRLLIQVRHRRAAMMQPHKQLQSTPTALPRGIHPLSNLPPLAVASDLDPAGSVDGNG
jgi:hypothetical protein